MRLGAPINLDARWNGRSLELPNGTATLLASRDASRRSSSADTRERLAGDDRSRRLFSQVPSQRDIAKRADSRPEPGCPKIRGMGVAREHMNPAAREQLFSRTLATAAEPAVEGRRCDLDERPGRHERRKPVGSLLDVRIALGMAE